MVAGTIADRMFSWTAIAHPGLEPVVSRELEQRGVAAEVEAGAVVFRASLEQGAALAHSLRTPDHLRCAVIEGPARSYEQLSALVRKADWRPFLRPRGPVEVRVSARSSKLHHRDAVARKVEHALRDALRGAGRPARSPGVAQRVEVRLVDDVATVSLSAGGDLLHRRGWRSRAGKAPLRENLAASLLVAAGWDGEEALVDPFCGSGTILIEAGLMAQGRSPFVGRTLACVGWPALERWRPPAPRARPVEVALVGSDREPRALLAAQEQARAAGVSVEWLHRDVAEADAPAPTGLVVTNPPYGKRLGENVRGVYATFGRTLRERFGGWRALFLAPSPDLARRVDRAAWPLTTFQNGGVRVGAYVLEL